MLEIRRGNNSASDIKTISDGDLDEEDEQIYGRCYTQKR